MEKAIVGVTETPEVKKNPVPENFKKKEKEETKEDKVEETTTEEVEKEVAKEETKEEKVATNKTFVKSNPEGGAISPRQIKEGKFRSAKEMYIHSIKTNRKYIEDMKQDKKYMKEFEAKKEWLFVYIGGTGSVVLSHKDTTIRIDITNSPYKCENLELAKILFGVPALKYSA